MFTNPLLAKLKIKDFVIGTMITEIRNPLIISLLIESGYDFAIVDLEHGTFTHSDIAQFVMAAKRTEFTVLVRPPGSDYISIAKVWDSGAQGIMVPRVETKEEAYNITQYSKYPPIGKRGYGPRGIITDFSKVSMQEKITTINANTMIILQIENESAIKNIEEMIKFPEINAAIIGPNDLSISLGIPGDYKSEKFTNSVNKVLKACQNRNIPAGIHTDNMEQLKYWKKKGMRMLMYSTPFNMMKDAAKSSIDTILN